MDYDILDVSTPRGTLFERYTALALDQCEKNKKIDSINLKLEVGIHGRGSSRKKKQEKTKLFSRCFAPKNWKQRLFFTLAFSKIYASQADISNVNILLWRHSPT